MPNTYTELRRTVVGTATPSITFDLTGVSGYTDLVIIATGTASALGNLSLRFNGDTTSNYSRTMLYGNGSTATSYRVSNYSGIPLGDFDTSQIATHIINIQNYSNATTNKTVLARWNNNAGTYASLGATASLWRNTAAITSITIYDDAGNLSTGSTFSLYGIAAANAGVAKATGGTIYYGADGYIYHAFTSSGSFVPSSSLTADIFVVAGGGGGGSQVGGGGGAGGLLSFTSQSLSAISYTCTVGAGGAAGTYTNTGPVTNRGSSGTNSQFGSLTACVGGGGGGGYSTWPGLNGGSGGGADGGGPTGIGTGTSGQGYAGGTGFSASWAGGGGGGAGAVGGNAAANVGGNGGIGATSAFINAIGATTNTGQLSSGNYYYAGGGGGCNSDNTAGNVGTGGLGGGARGTNNSQTTPPAGTANTGGGGGGSRDSIAPFFSLPSAGGSGLIVVRYLG